MGALLSKDIRAFQASKVRFFVQRHVANPSEAYNYWGRMQMDGPKDSRDEPERRRSPSDERRNAWITVDVVSRDKNPGTAGFEMWMDRELAEDLHEMIQYDEEFTLQAVVGDSEHPQTFEQWDSKMILPRKHITELGPDGAMNPLDGGDNDDVKLTGTMWYDDLIMIKKLKGTQTASAATVREVVDAAVRWVDSRNRWRWYQLLTNTAATTPSAILIGKGRETTTWSTLTPSVLSTAGQLVRMDIMGDYLVALRSENPSESHLYITLDDLDAGTDNFTAKTGYTANKGPRAIYVRSASQAIIVGLGGYIYQIDGPRSTPSVIDAGAATAQNLNDVHGSGDVVVAVGASNALVFSVDRGATFAARTGPIVGQALNAVWCLSEDEWFIGAGNGKLYFTEDKGLNWTEVSVESDLTSIDRIKFYDRYTGYIAANASAATVKGRTYRSTDSGRTWRRTAPDISNAVTANEINVLAVADQNRILSAGLVSGTTGIAQFLKGS
jgi:hypothetical protein